MTSRFTLFALLAFLCFSFSAAYSQTDSTHFDLGRLRVDKNSTQNITLKAADLERFPAANLSDALNVWLYGTYTNSNSVLYVVDGNIATDIRIYSIYDIEEVTLIQSATAQTTGAKSMQQLVLIKTKRNRPGKSGIETAAQTSLVNTRNTQGTGYSSTTNLYHQYYVSAYKNTDNVNMGISASYLRDVTPFSKSPSYIYDIKNPYSNNIFRFNGYTDIKLGQNNTLSATAGYSPQINKLNYSSNITANNTGEGSSQTQDDINNRLNQNLFNASVQLNSQIVKGLHNKFIASYNHYSYLQKYLTNYFVSGSDINGTQTHIQDSLSEHQTTYLLSDNLSYQKNLGDFSLEPAVNFSYRHSRDTVSYQYVAVTYLSNDHSLGSASSNTTHISTRIKEYFLTPSLSLSYKSSINIQGGFLMILNSKQQLEVPGHDAIKRVYPFISAGIDVSKLIKLETVGIRLFGSFAKQNAITQLDASELPIYYWNSYTSYFGPNLSSDLLKPYNSYKAGAVFDISKIVSISYNYERGTYLEQITYSTPYQSSFQIVPVRFTLNRIGLNFNVINTPAVHYISNLNATNNKQIIPFNANYETNLIVLGRGTWTGGWVNRFDYKNIFAGLDVLYQMGKAGSFNSYISLNPLIAGQNAHSFSLQNLYFGCRVKSTQFKNLEVYANGRNIWQNKNSDITDNRRFYGIGLRTGF